MTGNIGETREYIEYCKWKLNELRKSQRWYHSRETKKTYRICILDVEAELFRATQHLNKINIDID